MSSHDNYPNIIRPMNSKNRVFETLGVGTSAHLNIDNIHVPWDGTHYDDGVTFSLGRFVTDDKDKNEKKGSRGHVKITDNLAEYTLSFKGYDAHQNIAINGDSGSGKTVMTKTILDSLILRYSPDKLRIGILDAQDMGDLDRYAHGPHSEFHLNKNTPISGDSFMRTIVDEFSDTLDDLIEKLDKDHEDNSSNDTLVNKPSVVIVINGWDKLVMGHGSQDSTLEIESKIEKVAKKHQIHVITINQEPDAIIGRGYGHNYFSNPDHTSTILFGFSNDSYTTDVLSEHEANRVRSLPSFLSIPLGFVDDKLRVRDKNLDYRVNESFHYREKDSAYLIAYAPEVSAFPYTDTTSAVLGIADYNHRLRNR